VVERIPEEVHVAALPSGLGHDLADRTDQAGMIVGDQLDTQAAALQREEQVLNSTMGSRCGLCRTITTTGRF
jgi:hypothetical protein